MKIEKIEIRAVESHFLPKENMNVGEIFLGKWTVNRFVIVKVITDDGLIGWGESAPFARVSDQGQMSIIGVLTDNLAPAIIGMDPFNVEGIWKKMDRATPNNPQAKGTLDMALYDIMGKATGQPAYNFLGGAVHKEIPLQGIVTLDTIDNMKIGVEKLLDEGYKTIRIKLGVGDIYKDMEIVREVRKMLGPGVPLRVDPNQAYSLKEALKLIPVLEENDIEIFEQPIHWANKEGLAQINASTWIPVMPHESLSSIHDFRELIDLRAASLFTLKTDRPGGLTKMRVARDMAEVYHIPCVIMSSVEMAVSTLASMQFAATLKEIPFACEASGPFEIEDIADIRDHYKDGKFLITDEPGFGLHIDEAKLDGFTKQTWIIDRDSEVKD